MKLTEEIEEFINLTITEHMRKSYADWKLSQLSVTEPDEIAPTIPGRQPPARAGAIRPRAWRIAGIPAPFGIKAIIARPRRPFCPSAKTTAPAHPAPHARKKTCARTARAGQRRRDVPVLSFFLKDKKEDADELI